MKKNSSLQVGLIVATLLAGLLASSCSQEKMPNQMLVPKLDLDRFMGKWYVHGHSPTFLDKNAYAATEVYEKGEDGKILTTYSFRKGSLDGKQKTYRPVGQVYDTQSNAEWRMKFFGILNAPYYILYVDNEYETTVIGHPNKEMAWIMSRTPEMSDQLYGRLKSELSKRDYKLGDFRRIPH